MELGLSPEPLTCLGLCGTRIGALACAGKVAMKSLFLKVLVQWVTDTVRGAGTTILVPARHWGLPHNGGKSFLPPGLPKHSRQVPCWLLTAPVFSAWL